MKEGHWTAEVTLNLHRGEEAMGVVRGEEPSARNHFHGDLEASRTIRPAVGQEGGLEEGPRVRRPAVRPAHRESFAGQSVTATVPSASVSPRCRAAVAATRLQEAPRPAPRNLRKALSLISALLRIDTSCCC